MKIRHYAQGKFYTIQCPEGTKIIRRSTFRASGNSDPCDGIVFPFKGKDLRIPAEPPELLPLLAESGNFGVSLVGEPEPDVSLARVACSECREADVNWLQLGDDQETVHCDRCGAEFGLPWPSIGSIAITERLEGRS